MSSINVARSVMALRHLPVFSWTYRNEASTDELCTDNDHKYPEWQAKNCPTCLEDYQRGDIVVKTSCGHYQHKECFMQDFLIRNEYRCSVCRADLWTPWAKRAIEVERQCYTERMTDPEIVVRYYRNEIHEKSPPGADVEGPAVVDETTKRAIAFAIMGVDMMCNLYWEIGRHDAAKEDLLMLYAFEMWDAGYRVTACTPEEQEMMASTLEDKVRGCINSAVFPESGLFPWTKREVCGASAKRERARRMDQRDYIEGMVARVREDQEEAQGGWETLSEQHEEVAEEEDDGLGRVQGREEAFEERVMNCGGAAKGNRRRTI